MLCIMMMHPNPLQLPLPMIMVSCILQALNRIYLSVQRPSKSDLFKCQFIATFYVFSLSTYSSSLQACVLLENIYSSSHSLLTLFSIFRLHDLNTILFCCPTLHPSFHLQHMHHIFRFVTEQLPFYPSSFLSKLI